MKVGAFREALGRLPIVTPQAFTGGEPFVVLSPHPDDESLGVGGLIAAACAQGQRVHVVVLTDGAGSHPKSRLFPPERLVALRKAETAAAAARLGLSIPAVTHLDLPDTRAPIRGPDFDKAVSRLIEIVRESHATRLLVTWGRDPHCDHEAAAAMAIALRDALPHIALWSYPIWGWHLDAEARIDDPAPEGFRIDIAPWLASKRAAIAAHASQMTDLIDDDPDGFRFTPVTLRPFLAPVETLFKVPS